MKILVFSDIHGDLKALEKLMDTEADYYFAAGDMVSWGRGLDDIGKILQKRAAQTYVLPGNHETEDQIRAMCERFSLQAFHGKTFASNGYRFAGLGYSNPTPFHTPGEYSEEQLARRLDRFVGLRPLVLVCHCPPLRTALDEASKGVHLGSRSVREFVEREQPEYFFCGHIHESAGRKDMLGDSRGVNAGKSGYLLDLATIEP